MCSFRLKQFTGKGVLVTEDEYLQAMEKFNKLDKNGSSFTNRIATPVQIKRVSTYKGTCYSLKAEYFATKEHSNEGIQLNFVGAFHFNFGKISRLDDNTII